MATTTMNPTVTAIPLTMPATNGRRSLFILVTLLIMVMVIQAQNLFRYPYYQDVEGTNLANTWALTTSGHLTPYTYAYDDPPVGEFIMAGWMNLTGGINTFGFPINSGRLLMLLLHVISAGLVFGIARKLTSSDLAASIALLIFAFSPLSVAAQRSVLLENIELVFLLISIYLVIGPRRTLRTYILSAIFFGLAVLSKGSGLFFLPAFLYIIHAQAHPHHKRFALTLWLTLTIMVLVFYPMYAQMKQELFPQGWLLGGDFPHVSLVQRMLDRGPVNGRFLNFAAGLSDAVNSWTDSTKQTADPILFFGGAISFLYVILLSIDNINLRPLVALGFAYLIYLGFGGQIFDSAIILLLPILAMSVAIVLNSAVKWITHVAPAGMLRFALIVIVVGVLLYPFAMLYANRLGLYTLDQVSGELAALDWVKKNVPATATVVTDNFAFVDLRQTMPNIHYYWKVDTDPAVKFNLLQDNQCNIDYLISTPQVYADTANYKFELMKKALDNSQLLMRFANNGWPVEIRQISKLNCAPNATAAS